jgi:hypothetical protein
MGVTVIFGIWPGVVAADLVSLRPLGCPPEDTAKTLAALVGVNAAGVPDPAFWNQLAGAIGPHNTRRLDYVGLDAFPPLPST